VGRIRNHKKLPSLKGLGVINPADPALKGGAIFFRAYGAALSALHP